LPDRFRIIGPRTPFKTARSQDQQEPTAELICGAAKGRSRPSPTGVRDKPGILPGHMAAATPAPRELLKRMESMKDLTEKTIALLRRASDFAAAAHDHNFIETEIDGERINAITLELQLRTMAGKLEYATRTKRPQTHTGA
jgi:hypothetical protein